MTPQEFRIWADGFAAGRSTYTADEVGILLNKLYTEVDGFCLLPKDLTAYLGKITWVDIPAWSEAKRR